MKTIYVKSIEPAALAAEFGAEYPKIMTAVMNGDIALKVRVE